MPRSRTPHIPFCAALAAAMVGLRVASYDHRIFTLRSLPNHDMYQGAAFFATNMHSLRLSGDIAWWNPVVDGGYAQYYQSFLAPLAPTSHHVVFVLWAQVVRALDLVGIALPEYLQYLGINYVVLPFLTFLAVAVLLSLVFRSRITVTLVMTAFVLSGIGVWNSAWFYFQEPFSLFLLLATGLAFCHRPGPRGLALFGLAVLVQMTSANYWTLYNVLFLAIVTSTFAWIYRGTVRRAVGYATGVISSRQPLAVAAFALVAVTGVTWVGLAGLIAHEQGSSYIRTEGSFDETTAFARVKEARQFTIELFNPSLERAIGNYPQESAVHNARYVGAVFLPFLLLFAGFRWRRRERWLAVTAALVLAVCLAPGALLGAWAAIPSMDKVRHLFYFYTQYWQLLVVLIAAAALDRLLAGRIDTRTRTRLTRISVAFAAVLVVLLLGLIFSSQQFALNDPDLQAMLILAVVSLVTTAALLQVLWQPAAQSARTVLAAVVLIAGAADLSRYFFDANVRDARYTHERFGAPRVALPDDAQRTMRQAWRRPQTDAGFPADLERRLPVRSGFWPTNGYMVSTQRKELDAASPAFQTAVARSPAVEFRTSAHVASDSHDLALRLAREPALASALWLQARPDELQAPTEASAPEGSTGFQFRWRRWTYNGFTFEVVAAKPGWLFVHQLHDPAWQAAVDGGRVDVVRANLVGMALPLAAGRHTVTLDYRPLARRLYWPSVVLLDVTVAVLLGIALLSGRRSAGGEARS